MKETLFYIFRHGQTDWNKEGRLQGHSDIELNTTGIEQAINLKQKFINLKLTELIKEVYTSDLKRAHKTCSLIFENSPIILEPKLREMNIGKLEGVSKQELQSILGENFIEILTGPHDFQFPDGESKFEQKERMVNTLLDIHQKSKASHIAISTHGGSMARVLEKCHNFPKNHYLDNCALAEVLVKDANFEFLRFL